MKFSIQHLEYQIGKKKISHFPTCFSISFPKEMKRKNTQFVYLFMPKNVKRGQNNSQQSNLNKENSFILISTTF